MKFILPTIASLLILSSSVSSFAQTNPDEQQYTTIFPLQCIPKIKFVELIPKTFKPIFQFSPNKDAIGIEEMNSYLFMNDEGEFFITLPANNPSHICIAQSGMISSYNIKAIQNYLLKDSI